MTSSQDKKKERQVFDRLSEDEYSEAHEADYQRLYARFFDGFEVRNKELLDIGCGPGINSVRLAKLGLKVTGMDLSDRAVIKARVLSKKAGVDVRFIVGDAEKTHFRDDSFDFVFCGAVLHHFPNLKKISREIYRVTKPGGMVLSYDPNAHHPYGLIVHNVLNRFIRLKYFSPNERALRDRDLFVPFSEAGFKNFRFSSITMQTKKKGLVRRCIRKTAYRVSELLLQGLHKRPFLVMICEKE